MTTTATSLERIGERLNTMTDTMLGRRKPPVFRGSTMVATYQHELTRNVIMTSPFLLGDDS